MSKEDSKTELEELVILNAETLAKLQKAGISNEEIMKTIIEEGRMVDFTPSDAKEDETNE